MFPLSACISGLETARLWFSLPDTLLEHHARQMNTAVEYQYVLGCHHPPVKHPAAVGRHPFTCSSCVLVVVCTLPADAAQVRDRHAGDERVRTVQGGRLRFLPGNVQAGGPGKSRILSVGLNSSFSRSHGQTLHQRKHAVREQWHRGYTRKEGG